MNKYFIQTVFFFAAIFGVVVNAVAQENDAGLWTSVAIEKKISKQMSVALSEELRFYENVTELGTAFTEIGISYKPIKNLSVGFAYRFIQKRMVNDFYSMRHRYIIDAAYKLKLNKWSVTLRERFQTEYRDINSSAEGGLPLRTLRSKLTCKYEDLKKVTPFISAEVFYELNSPDGNQIDNTRYIAGINYEFNKKNSVDLSFIINKEVMVVNPVTQYITSIGYTFSF